MSNYILIPNFVAPKPLYKFSRFQKLDILINIPKFTDDLGKNRRANEIPNSDYLLRPISMSLKPQTVIEDKDEDEFQIFDGEISINEYNNTISDTQRKSDQDPLHDSKSKNSKEKKRPIQEELRYSKGNEVNEMKIIEPFDRNQSKSKHYNNNKFQSLSELLDKDNTNLDAFNEPKKKKNNNKSANDNPSQSRQLSSIALHDFSSNITSNDFLGIQNVCRNAGSSKAGLETLYSLCLDKRISVSFILRDLTTNHVTSTVKLCTPSVPCINWFCACDRHIRSKKISNQILGVIISIDEDPHAYFLPLQPCIDQISDESKVQENFPMFEYQDKLPLRCNTSLVDRWSVLFNILVNPNIIKYIFNLQLFLLPIHNGFLNILQMEHYTGIFPNIFDPRVASYMMNSDIEEPDLEFDRLFNAQLDKIHHIYEDLSFGRITRAISRLKPEVCLILNSCKPLEDSLTKFQIFDIFINIEMPITCLLSQMELIGVNINIIRFQEVELLLKNKLKDVSERIYSLAGYNFMISSPEQVSTLLFQKLGLTPGSTDQQTSKFLSTSEEELSKIQEKHPIIPLILHYRTYHKLLTTYIEGFKIHIVNYSNYSSLNNIKNPFPSFTIHALWNQTSVRTGRLSCCRPNLQNIPSNVRVDDIEFSIRSLFIPNQDQDRKRKFFLSADYSQIEMRILAHLSCDMNLINLFKNEGDVYRMLASKILNKNIDLISDDERNRAKVICLGVIYGMGPQAASAKLNIDLSMAIKITNSFFGYFSKVKIWINKMKEQARAYGHIKTLMGRMRRIQNIMSEDPKLRATAERQAVNSIIQGTASDLIKCAMIMTTEKLACDPVVNSLFSKSMPRLVMQIHDELIFELSDEPSENMQYFVSYIKTTMEKEVAHKMNLQVPLLANVSLGENWGEMRDWYIHSGSMNV